MRGQDSAVRASGRVCGHGIEFLAFVNVQIFLLYG